VLHRLFPFLSWLPELGDRRVLQADLIAGATMAMILIPQSMAYAHLAGLPPVYGLYAAFLPPVVAALFGSSRQLATGPVAMASLISASTVQYLATSGTDSYIAYSILLALMVGVLRLGLGLLRLGILVNLLSVPVVVGFTNAAALIIATSQLHHILGVEAVKGAYHFQTVWSVLQTVAGGVEWATVGMALFSGVLLLGLRRWLPQFPHVLNAVFVATLFSWAVGYEGAVIGEIPVGLPVFTWPAIDWVVIPELIFGALTLTLVGLMEAMSIAKTIATQTRQRLDVNQELIGQGLANLVGGFFQSYTVSGSFSRSAVNHYSGARTGFSSVVSSLVVTLTLLFLTPLLYYLPQATLAMVIVSALFNLMQISPISRAWRVSRGDALVGVLTFVVTLATAPQLHLGIGVGVVLTLVLYLKRTMRPHVAFLARHTDGTLRDAAVHGLALDQRIAIIRFDGRLFFGDSGYFEDKVNQAVSRLPELRYLVLDAGGINQVDASGEQTLRLMVERLRQAGIDVFFTRAKSQFTEALERSGSLDFIGRDHFFAWNQHALEHLWNRMEPAYRARCRLNVTMPQRRGGIWSI
jgi:sulfate permease, SulP family